MNMTKKGAVQEGIFRVDHSGHDVRKMYRTYPMAWQTGEYLYCLTCNRVSNK